MKWVTRARPKTDRIACPWLILRFIDPAAEIIYTEPDQVLDVTAREGGYSFDAPGATYRHRHHPDGRQWCTFETLLHTHDLTRDAAPVELARIVHAADIATDVDTHPFGAAVRAIGEAGADVEDDDQQLLARAMFVYDALSAHCQRGTAQRATPQ